MEYPQYPPPQQPASPYGSPGATRARASSPLADEQMPTGAPYAIRRPPLWLRMVGWQSGVPLRSTRDQDRQRRSTNLAWTILGLFVVDALLIIAGLGDPATEAAVAGGAATLLAAALLNRAGFVSAAGWTVILLADVLIVFTLIFTVPQETGKATIGTLSMANMPGYDFYLISLVVAAAVLRPRWIWVVMALNSTIILADYFLQPHAGELVTLEYLDGGALWGGLSLVARPVALQVLIATVSYLATTGLLGALSRALNADARAAYQDAAHDADKMRIFASLQQHVLRLKLILKLPADTRPQRLGAAWRMGLRRVDLLAASSTLETLLRDIDLCATQAQMLPTLAPERVALERLMHALQRVTRRQAPPQALVTEQYESAVVAQLARTLAELYGAAEHYAGVLATGRGTSQPTQPNAAPWSPPNSPLPFTPSSPLSAPGLIDDSAVPPWLRGDR